MTTDARTLAQQVLRRVSTQKAFASSALRAAFDQAPDLSGVDRALATELVYGVLRRRNFLDRAVRQVSGKRLKDIDPKLHDILRIAAYQIMYLDRIPDRAAVHTAVNMAKRRVGPKGGAFVNAILRKLASATPDQRVASIPKLEKDPAGHVAATGGLPHHLAARLVADLGSETARDFAMASLDPAPLTLRTNLMKTTQQALLEEVGGTAGQTPWSVILPSSVGALPAQLPAVIEGRATPQDEASMQVVALLDPQPGETILDVCAAPGGKTTHIAERMEDTGQIVAHDRHPGRLKRVQQAADRLGLTSITIEDLLPEPDTRFDRVLVDAPCSGLGTLRRHPEIRWRWQPDDTETLAKTQTSILNEVRNFVRPGGVLVYSVCTVTKAEGEAHLDQLASDFEVQQILRIGPHQEGAPDGFFAARLVKTT